MNTIANVSQDVPANCSFSATRIDLRTKYSNKSAIGKTETITLSVAQYKKASYRKSYIAWDKLERANKPDNYTEKTKYLSKNAKALLSVVYQKLKKQPILLLNHKYISTITCSGSRQNQRIIQEIEKIIDVCYKTGITELKGKKYKNCYEFKLKRSSINNGFSQENNYNDENIQRTKMSTKNTACTIYIENKIINNRSKANFEKNYSSDENSNTQTDSKIEKGRNKASNDQVITAETTRQIVSKDSVSNISCNTKKQAISNNPNGFLGSGKFLSEMLEHLTEDMCQSIRSNCGRNFTNRAIKEIAKAVSRSKKGSKAFFYHIKGFIAYLSKILRFEKRDPEKVSGDNYYITSNLPEEEQDIQKQEKYLSEIEYSLQVSPEWHLKKKLAAVLERSKAYDILTSFQSLDIRKRKALITVNKHVELSKEDRNIILNQIQATHEKTGEEGNYQYIDSLEIVMADRSPSPTAFWASSVESDQDLQMRQGLWGKVREKFARLEGSEGDAIDKVLSLLLFNS
ncbi:MAG: hypothetical protein P8P83_05905 [Rickettsiaceae bacterium]|nr:hypothetical protein [Rickettsiaceae bacterium]